MPQIDCRCSQKAIRLLLPWTTPQHMALVLDGIDLQYSVIGWLPRIGRTEGVGRIRGVIQREGKGFADSVLC